MRILQIESNLGRVISLAESALTINWYIVLSFKLGSASMFN